MHDLHWFFEPVVVEVNDDPTVDKPIKAFMYAIETGKDYRLMYPLILDPSSRLNHFEEKPPFDPTKYLQNPMIIMIGVTLLLNQMMKGMDKKDLAEAQKNQSEMMGNVNPNCQQQ